MDEQRARQILGEFPGDDIAYNLGDSYSSVFVNWDPRDGYVRIDGYLTVEQLEAIVWWIKNKGSEAIDCE